MKKVRRENSNEIGLDEVPYYFNNGGIVILEDNGNIYKLSVIQHSNNKKYAFVSLNGRSWFNGSYSSINNLLTHMATTPNIRVMESVNEYITWLNSITSDINE